jgi:tRNA A-37 threonylcarbamoyl transferase component Bud32
LNIDRLGKHNTTESLVDTHRLPAELVEGAVWRLGWAGAAYAACYAIIDLVYRILVKDRPAEHWIFGPITGIAVASGIAVFLLMRTPRLRGEQKLAIGLVFEVVGALLIGVNEWVIPLLPDERIRGFSAISAWVLIFGMAVPANWWKATVAALLSAWMSGFGLVVTIWLLHVPVPTAAQITIWMVPPTIFATIGILLSRLLYQMGIRISREKELGSYELLEKLGAGGMGEVWRARHRMLAREAAIKLIAPREVTRNSAEAMSVVRLRFEREAKATAGLRSPHTVTIFDYGMTENGALYYVMEIVNGIDLETLIERFGPVPAGRAIWLLRQICRSLEEAHAVGLTHRDIKPRNIMVGQCGLDSDFAKVLDFGLVKAIEDAESAKLTREGMTTGTPAYMAPELAIGSGNVDARADLYAVGCVGYWLLTGRTVFEAPSGMAMALAHVQSEPVAPSQRTELPVPPDLDEILLACLAKDPAGRPPSARALRAKLEASTASRDWDEEAGYRWWQSHAPELLTLTPAG